MDHSKKTDFDNLELFCRVNIQSEMPHREFVSFIAPKVGGVNRMNSIKGGTLDISVDDNDVFDPGKAHTGEDRWLYFRYTLEIDPIESVPPSDYIAAIGALLESLWSSGIDAVASCDFEQQLPRNVRRLKWARIPRPEGAGVGGMGRTGVANVVIPAAGGPVALDACVRIVQRHWPHARFEDAVTGKKYRSYDEIPLGRVQELLTYRDSQAEAAWDAGSPASPPNSMLHLIHSPSSMVVELDDPSAADMRSMLESIRGILGTDILNTYAEAA